MSDYEYRVQTIKYRMGMASYNTEFIDFIKFLIEREFSVTVESEAGKGSTIEAERMVKVK